jgi:hypothetical protein
MRDVKPKRTARESGPRKISPDETEPNATAPEIVPKTPQAEEIVSARPAAVAEPAPEIVSASAERQTDSVDDPWTAFTDAQAVLARGFEEIAAEVGGLTRSGIAAAADAAVALIGVRTFSEALEINAALARRGTDAMIEGSAKLSEIGAKAMTEAARPILSRFGGPWSGEAVG